MDENQTADFDSTLNEEWTPVVDETPEVKPQAGSAVKLLKQRNEARSKLEEMEKTHVPMDEVKKMKEQMSKLEEMIVGRTLQDEVTKEKSAFFEQTPKAKEFEADIDKLMSEKDLTAEQAFRLVAAEKNPNLLLDEQQLNKQSSNAWFGWVPKSNDHKVLTEMDADEARNMSDDDFLRQSEALATKSRIADWKLR